jgi:protein-S-isoprenylcysteine O-methyltransferase Ste14
VSVVAYRLETLRLILFLGLALHKLVWEALKIRDGCSRASQKPRKSSGSWPVKIAKSVILVFLGFQTLFLDIFPIFGQPRHLRLVGTGLYFLGLATAITGRLQLGKNWADLEDFQVLPDQSLVTSGIYRYIRHPIYTGDILLLLGLELALNSWLVFLVSVPLVVAVRQAFAEEALLAQALSGYEDYCRRTKRFIPFVL